MHTCTFVDVKVVIELETVRRTPLCHAGGQELAAEVDGIKMLASRICNGFGVDEKHLESYSDVFKLCMTRIGNFCIVAVGAGYKNAIKGPAGKASLLGLAAIEYKYADVANDVSNGKMLTLVDVEDFRKYGWLLDKAKKAQVSEWIQHIIKAGKDVPVAGVICDAPMAEYATVGGKWILGDGATSSSSSYKAVVLHGGVGSGTAPNSSDKTDKLPSGSARILEFFSRKTWIQL
jgi:hypothetical protein